MLPKVKLDITADEVLADRPILRPIGHPYGDAPLPGGRVLCYSITELFAEKLRTLAERCRPRDLYDVVHMHRHPDLIGRQKPVAAALARKCGHAGINVPTLDTIRSSPFRQEIEAEWENMLGHQIPQPLPPFTGFWSGLDDVFRWLTARSESASCRGLRSVTLTQPGRSRRPSPHGDAASHLSYFATRGSTVSRSISTTALRADGRDHAVSSPTLCAEPETGT